MRMCKRNYKKSVKTVNNTSDITFRSIITKVTEVITSGKVLQLLWSMQGDMKNLIENDYNNVLTERMAKIQSGGKTGDLGNKKILGM